MSNPDSESEEKGSQLEIRASRAESAYFKQDSHQPALEVIIYCFILVRVLGIESNLSDMYSPILVRIRKARKQKIRSEKFMMNSDLK